MHNLAWILALTFLCSARAEMDLELECVKSWQNMTRVFYTNRSCYVVPENATDWQKAKESCAHMGAQLALITHKQQMIAVANGLALKTGVWIGLVRENCTELNDSCQANQAHEGWVYVKDDASIQVKKAFDLWAEGQPVPGAGDAAVLTTQGLRNHNRSLSKGYICEQVFPPSEKTDFKGRKRHSKPQQLSELNSVVKSVHECGIKCHSMASCKSYAFDYNTKICYLYWLASDALEFVPSNQFMVMDKQIEEPSHYCPTLTDESAEITYSVSEQYHHVPAGSTVSVKCKYGAQNEINATCLAPHWSKAIIECLEPHILVFGGETSGQSVESFYPENPSKNQLESTLMSPFEMGRLAGVIGNKVILVGGYDYNAGYCPRACTIYDPSTKNFTQGPNMTVPGRRNAAGVVHDDIFYLCGGMNPESGDEMSSCEMFTGDTWVLMAPMSVARSFHAMAALNGKIYAIGGMTTDSVEMYDIESETWETSTSGIQQYGSAGRAATLGKHIYMCVETSCYKYTNETDGWSQIADLNVYIDPVQLLAVGEKLMAFGGFGGSERRVEEYDPVTDAWTVHQTSLIESRQYAAAVFLY